MRKSDIGKRAGVTAGILGALCVLGELCFLFPHLLVSHDAMPFSWRIRFGRTTRRRTGEVSR